MGDHIRIAKGKKDPRVRKGGEEERQDDPRDQERQVDPPAGKRHGGRLGVQERPF